MIAVAVGVWTAVVGGYAIWRHQQFLSHRYDLGNMVQAVWSTAHGRPLEMTDGATGEQIVRLGAHVDPILVLLTPLWLVAPVPETLILAQAVLLASGVYPVVRLADKYVGNATCTVLLGAWYLVFPWMLWSALNDFHPVALATPLLLYAIWFLDEQRLGLFAVFAGLALMTGELVGLTIAGLGLWYGLRYRRWMVASTIALLGAGWTAICLTVIVPAFNDGEESRFYNRFESVGGSPTGLLRTLLDDPGAILSAITTSVDRAYVVALLVPTAFLALGSPLLLLAALPQVGINLLSDWWSTTQPQFHYGAAVLPILIAAAIMAVRRFHDRFRVLICALMLGCAFLGLLIDTPRPGAQDFVFARLEPPARRAAMRDALALVPPDDPVTASNRLGAHVSGRRIVHLFPMRESSMWVLLDLRNPWLQVAGERADPVRFRTEVARLEQDGNWNVVYDRADIRVYRRVEPSQ